MGLRWLLLMAVLLHGAAAHAGEALAPGVRMMTAEAPARGARIGVTLWYPAAPIAAARDPANMSALML